MVSLSNHAFRSPYRQRRLLVSCLLNGRAGTRPGRRRTFLFAQESRQRSAPRLPGPTGYPRCGRPAGPVAKLAGQKPAVVGQRARTSPGEPPSLGGSEGMKGVARWSSCRNQLLSRLLSFFSWRLFDTDTKLISLRRRRWVMVNPIYPIATRCGDIAKDRIELTFCHDEGAGHTNYLECFCVLQWLNYRRLKAQA